MPEGVCNAHAGIICISAFRENENNDKNYCIPCGDVV